MSKDTLVILIVIFGAIFCVLGLVPMFAAIFISKSRKKAAQFQQQVSEISRTDDVTPPVADTPAVEVDAEEFDPLENPTANATDDEWGSTKFGFDESDWNSEFDKTDNDEDDHEPEVTIHRG